MEDRHWLPVLLQVVALSAFFIYVPWMRKEEQRSQSRWRFVILGLILVLMVLSLYLDFAWWYGYGVAVIVVGAIALGMAALFAAWRVIRWHARRNWLYPEPEQPDEPANRQP